MGVMFGVCKMQQNVVASLQTFMKSGRVNALPCMPTMSNEGNGVLVSNLHIPAKVESTRRETWVLVGMKQQH